MIFFKTYIFLICLVLPEILKQKFFEQSGTKKNLTFFMNRLCNTLLAPENRILFNIFKTDIFLIGLVLLEIIMKFFFGTFKNGLKLLLDHGVATPSSFYLIFSTFKVSKT